MNRREFTKGLAAAGMVPALPIPSLGKAAQGAAAAKDPLYFWARFITRVHNKCSPAMLSRLLKLDPEHSAIIYDQMLADGAITAADEFGLSQSTEPLFQHFTKVTGHGGKLASQADANPSKTLDKLELGSDENDAPKEDPGPADEERPANEDALPEPEIIQADADDFTDR